MEEKLSHIKDGEAHMVNVGHKEVTHRTAIARCIVTFPQDVWGRLKEDGFNGKKGPILHTAKIAGIQASKRVDELIPLCHTLPLDSCEISFEEHAPSLHIYAQCEVHSKTGVEMEALTAANICALTVYDMCKALSHDIRITACELMSKTGGKRTFHREKT
ncbi:cyclic pyranopterin monophosphate synthase MoaC [Sanyastnella coralliicola]|uniref:cyclic pyranopterin monophosphate synthase MoaC n=1 Tax=Sanyastnella coralliicola TaxID=3069118 RepID=UPI0027BAD6A8|nr:cyclic pyranopterin monophosphate synthase MoaC [Longitalea sp. SCSIO 12813]